ncbi:MAG: 50S ribosomal protein L24, partial [Methanomicrobiaceae archaeon]|nr:50S ribosomal protein L24 [Methanomicrobiaceae archaeon]
GCVEYIGDIRGRATSREPHSKEARVLSRRCGCGKEAGEEGVVDEINARSSQLYVHGVSVTKADGTEVPRPVDPSNVQVIKLNLKDSMRAERLGGSE